MMTVAPAIAPVVGVFASASGSELAKSSVSLPAMRMPDAWATPVDATNATTGSQANLLVIANMYGSSLQTERFGAIWEKAAQPVQFQHQSRLHGFPGSLLSQDAEVFVRATLCRPGICIGDIGARLPTALTRTSHCPKCSGGHAQRRARRASNKTPEDRST